MKQVQREKELRLELAEARNPYLAKQFGDNKRRPPEKRKEEERRRAALHIRREKQKRRIRRLIMMFSVLLASCACLFILLSLFLKEEENAGVLDGSEADRAAFALEQKPSWTCDYLTPNEYSRPGEPLEEVRNIFVHYTANQGTGAAQNRSYFEQLKDTKERSASAHFIIGYEGEIIQCIPLDEIAYAVQTRNYDSISIECCYLEEDGSFTEATRKSLVELLTYLLSLYGLSSEDMLRHYDCGGKKCPIYYVENEEAWEKLKQEVEEKLTENKL